MGLFNLDGKVAVVTGGGKGIGAATVRMLADAGAQVTVFDLNATDGFFVDVTSEAAVQEAFARVAKQAGGVDILVNNAGRAARKPATELTVKDWNEVLELNLTAIFVCSKHPHPYMKKPGGGSIVNPASIMGLSGGLFPNAAYQRPRKAVW